MKPKQGQFKEDGTHTWPTPIGMGALADPEDFAAAKKREMERKAEEEAFDTGGMAAVNKMRGKDK